MIVLWESIRDNESEALLVPQQAQLLVHLGPDLLSRQAEEEYVQGQGKDRVLTGQLALAVWLIADPGHAAEEIASIVGL